MIPAVIALLAGLLFIVQPSHAHEGHDHGPKTPEITYKASPRVEATSDLYELVVVSQGDALVLWLDGFADNAPIDGAAMEVETRAGEITASPTGVGTFSVAAPWADEPGSYDLIVTITKDETVDIMAATLVIPDAAPTEKPTHLGNVGLLPGLLLVGFGFLACILLIGLLRAWPKRRSGTLAGMILIVAVALMVSDAALATDTERQHIRDQAQRLPDGSVFLPKASQRILGLRTVITTSAQHPRIVELPGRVIPDPAASGVVVAAIGGRLVPPSDGFPHLGRAVQEGEVLGYVQPALDAIDASDVQQQAGELDQQIAIIARRLNRLQEIQDVVARAQLEEAQIELNGLRERRRRLETAPRPSEALRAPVTGVVAAANAVIGQIAEPNAVLFQIINPDRLWIEALSNGPMLVPQQVTASLLDGQSVSLDWRGAGLSAMRQAVPVHFAITGGPPPLHLGQLVTVKATTQEVRVGIALDRASMLRNSNGQTLIWEHVAAERFVPREIRAEPLADNRVLVLSGIEAGRRVVTEGAELLNQIR